MQVSAKLVAAKLAANRSVSEFRAQLLFKFGLAGTRFLISWNLGMLRTAGNYTHARWIVFNFEFFEFESFDSFHLLNQ